MSKFEKIIQTMSGAILESVCGEIRDEAMDGDDVDYVLEFVSLVMNHDNGNMTDSEYYKARQEWLDRHLWKFATEEEVKEDVTDAHAYLGNLWGER